MLDNEDLVKLNRTRIQMTGFIFLFFLGALVARLAYLQIYKGKEYHEFSIKNRLRKENIFALRGRIYDKNGEVLVDNEPRYDVMITPQDLQDDKSTLKTLARLIDLSVESIEKDLLNKSTQARYIPVMIKKNINFDEVAKVESHLHELPGVSVRTYVARRYRDHDIGAHLLGYIAEVNQQQLEKLKAKQFKRTLGDFIGFMGVEKTADELLRGENGYQFVEVDARGRKNNNVINTNNLFSGIKNKKPIHGNHIRLTIDRDLQLSAAKALEGKVGAVVALDVHSGAVLSMVSSPSFLPGEFSTGLSHEYWSSLNNNKSQPMVNRNVYEHYMPGSTFKPFTALMLLEEGMINSHTRVNCKGKMKFGNRVFHCWKGGGHGSMDVVGALRESCNIFFQESIWRKDIDILAKYAKLFGFGSRLGIDLSREVSGLVPTKEWKKKRFNREWQHGETLSCAIGQSYLLVSTLQLANAYAALANRGDLYRPYIIDEISDSKGILIEKKEKELIRKIALKDLTWDLVQEGITQVAQDPRGTAIRYTKPGLKMAGKTGTAQVRGFSSERIYERCEDKPMEERHHGLSVAYAPSDNPQIAVAAIVEHGCAGSSAGVPVVSQVVETFTEKYLKSDLTTEPKP